MSESETIQKIYEELKILKHDVNFIKKHMFDEDTILTTEEAKIFEQSRKEFQQKNRKIIRRSIPKRCKKNS